jgi:hypothetical protein
MKQKGAHGLLSAFCGGIASCTDGMGISGTALENLGFTLNLGTSVVEAVPRHRSMYTVFAFLTRLRYFRTDLPRLCATHPSRQPRG